MVPKQLILQMKGRLRWKCDAKWWLLTALLIGLMGCSSSPTAEREKWRISLLRGPSAIAFAGWMEQQAQLAGKQLDIELIDSPQQMQAALIQQTSDIAVLPMVSAANLFNKGVRYELVGCPIWGTLYLVGRPTAWETEEPTIHLFGRGTTPDLLARHYLDQRGIRFTPNYSFATASEVAQGLQSGVVALAVLSEPYLSWVLRQDSTLQVLADLNQLDGAGEVAFAQTAILLRPGLPIQRQELDSLLEISCRFANQQPEAAIARLEERQFFPPHWMDRNSIQRCRITYRSAETASEEIRAFLELMLHYEPQAIGNRLPDAAFWGEQP
ncbi:MAG: ABC transporter substrate-binding protein [Parabacteroides sp.]|nr:ABC transporter substrate-binding protein [Parabacteroides sp.]